MTKSDKQFLAPTTRKGSGLLKDEKNYFPGPMKDWVALSPEEQHAHILDMGRGRCPFLGVPRPNERLEIVSLVESKLGFDDGQPAPWNYAALLSSPEPSRDMATKVSSGTVTIVHFDPLDEKAGFEAVDSGMHAFPHEQLDFYSRASRSNELMAKEWHSLVCAEWQTMLQAMAKFTIYSAQAEDHVRHLGFEKPKDWASATGILFQPLGKFLKIQESELWECWDINGASPFLLDKVMAAAKEDAPVLASKIRAKCSFDPDMRSDVLGFLEELKELYPADPAEAHYVVLSGSILKEFDSTAVPETNGEGAEVIVLKGKVAARGKIADLELL
jgi:hypothetical protein